MLTRRIAHRVADGSADAGHVLAITFTRRAAGELLRRLGALGLRAQPTVGTFHGVAWSVLRPSAGPTSSGPSPSCWPTRSGSSARLLDDLPTRGPRRHASRLDEVTAEIDWARARLVPAAA